MLEAVAVSEEQEGPLEIEVMGGVRRSVQPAVLAWLTEP